MRITADGTGWPWGRAGSAIRSIAPVAAALAAMSCGSSSPGQLEPSELTVRDSASGQWVRSFSCR